MLLVIAFTIVFAVTVGNLFEMAENNRYRFMLDALVWAVPIGALASFLETRRSTWTQRTERTERT
jgi:peptidoglycan/LPS O-acetylase OafA/YrhL